MNICPKCRTTGDTKFCPCCGSPMVPMYGQQQTDQVIQAEVRMTNITPPPVKYKGFWSVGRLVVGIITMTLSLFVLFQSCAVGTYNIYYETDSFQGTAGFLTSSMMLAGGITAVASRNSRKRGGSIACIVLYGLGAAAAAAGIGSSIFADLVFWCIVCGACCIMFIVCTVKHREDNEGRNI